MFYLILVTKITINKINIKQQQTETMVCCFAPLEAKMLRLRTERL